MLNEVDAQPTLPVKSLSRSRHFYEELLGLVPIGTGMPTVQHYQAGRSVLVLYESSFAGTNKGPAITWPLGDAFDATVEDLKAKGVAFLRYELPGLSFEDGVHVGHGMRLAWIKDPDGNIIHLGSFKPT